MRKGSRLAAVVMVGLIAGAAVVRSDPAGSVTPDVREKKHPGAAAAVAAAPADAPFGIDQREPFKAFLNGALPQKSVVQSGKWAVVEAFPNLTFDDPTAMNPVPRSNRLAVCGRQGKIWTFENDPKVKEKTELIDLTDVTQGWDDCGLLAFLFHPEFGKKDSPNRGYIYVWYHYSPHPIMGPKRPPVSTPGYNRLSRFTVADAPDGSLTADRKTELVLINQFDHNLWHEGSGMCFGNDGMLYVGLSDEGNSYDSFQNSQTITKRIFSGILRIDVDCDPKKSHPIRRQPLPEEKLPDGFTENNYTASYFIPNDNPWCKEDGSVLEEFWAIGIRNAHRMTLDKPTGQLWEGEIGQDRWEEINIIEKGGNYQWLWMEGFHPTVKNGVTQTRPAQIIGAEKPPIWDYEHGIEGKCIIGGYVYRGKHFAKELDGKYIYGDNGSGKVWALTWDGKGTGRPEYLCSVLPGTGYSGLSSFGEDQNGEIYLLKMGRPSKLLTLAKSEDAAKMANVSFSAPERLTWLGAFADMNKLKPVAGFVPYDVNTPLWSDGASKRRWVAVPTGKTIQFSPNGSWKFPEGTVFMKHFDLTVDEKTGEKRRLETRFLVRQVGGGVYGFTYRWRGGGGKNFEGDLVATGQSDTITIKTANGGTRNQEWYFPGPMDCLVCHNANANDVLGVTPRQINRTFEYPGGVTDNQLRTWNHLGLFDRWVDDEMIAKTPALVGLNDRTASLELRARSYLDANCAHCHRPNGAAGYFDARFDIPLAEQGLINGRLAKPDEVPGATVVCPGDVSKSMLYQRLVTTDKLLMPPLARNIIDEEARALLGEWIKGLPASK